MNYTEYLETAIKAARAGGEILKQGFNQNKSIEFKGLADPVTKYDKESEKTIVKILLDSYPGTSILTEEELSKENNSNLKWIIDPLDGTVNFIHQVPFIAVSIGVEYNNEIIAGVVFNPILNELFYASKNNGTFFNDTRINVSQTENINDIMVATGFPYDRSGRVKEIIKPLSVIIQDFRGIRRLGAASIDLAYTACGKFDAYYEENLKPWDTAGGKILVEEAGGKVTDYFNKPYSVYNNMILATNKKVHDNMIKILSSIKEKKNK